MNMLILAGNIGAEPEFKHYDSGKRRASFSVALDQYSKETEEAETFWLACYAWDSVCDRLERCKKHTKLSGRKINLAGTLAQGTWIDSKTGEKRSRIFVTIQMFDLLSASRVADVVQPDEARSDAEIIFDGKPVFATRSRYGRRQPRLK